MKVIKHREGESDATGTLIYVAGYASTTLRPCQGANRKTQWGGLVFVISLFRSRRGMNSSMNRSQKRSVESAASVTFIFSLEREKESLRGEQSNELIKLSIVPLNSAHWNMPFWFHHRKCWREHYVPFDPHKKRKANLRLHLSVASCCVSSINL